ncbi:Carbohydrate sulfotransferase 14 [Chionoecetes opilio]|uniref:Carbohydrate sulfotransferase n=1 Tax=Chionoecetes opilio TaxID=41210 RepID=A0A8J5CY16_CHIOP|nr:Carbohydrate sulfotransferase 14 [Chionoecetes opilio]
MTLGGARVIECDPGWGQGHRIPARVRRAGAETPRDPLPRPDNTRDPMMSSALLPDVRGRQHIMGDDVSRGKHSGDGIRLRFTQNRRDLETEFKRRQDDLVQGCKQHNARVAQPDLLWRSIFRPVLRGPLKICMIKKVASSTLLRVAEQLKNQIAETLRPLEAVVVRHPLARLASAYRDKYLNGKPLHEYNDEWRNKTQSQEPWDTRFVLYWLPALVSEGSVPQTREFNETLRKIRKAHQMYRRYLSQTGALLAHPSEVEEEFYGAEITEVAFNMIMTGPHIALVKGFMISYNLTNLMERFMNASFTFSQFLHHVVWTHEQGMPDLHWMTYTESCDPCRRRVDYILKLETIQEEVNHLFHGVLGYPEKVGFPVRHRSYNPSIGHSDGHYYTNVSRELMQRVLEIYKQDFTLFGYKHELPGFGRGMGIIPQSPQVKEISNMAWGVGRITHIPTCIMQVLLYKIKRQKVTSPPRGVEAKSVLCAHDVNGYRANGATAEVPLRQGRRSSNTPRCLVNRRRCPKWPRFYPIGRWRGMTTNPGTPTCRGPGWAHLQVLLKVSGQCPFASSEIRGAWFPRLAIAPAMPGRPSLSPLESLA